MKTLQVDAPIGIFDSGVGGLSVLRHIRGALPHEDLLYFADSGFAPYGDKSDAAIRQRALAVTAFLVQQRIKALVVACNTATATAIGTLRARYPALPVVGVEPGLKPAALLTHSGVVGVLATRATLASQKFVQLQQQVTAASGRRFVLQACIGLASRIEQGQLQTPATADLLRSYVAPLLAAGADTLVLGCTHYPFIRPLLDALLAELGAEALHIVDTGEAVSRRLHDLLTDMNLLRADSAGAVGSLHAYTSGSAPVLTQAFAHLLQLAPAVVAVPPAAMPACETPVPVCQPTVKFV